MNREQAIEKAAEFFDTPAELVDALVALGLLKLDTPDSVHKEGVAFIGKMTTISGWGCPDAVADDLAKAGFRIVRAP